MNPSYWEDSHKEYSDEEEMNHNPRPKKQREVREILGRSSAELSEIG